MKQNRVTLLFVALCLIAIPSPGSIGRGRNETQDTKTQAAITEEQKQAFALFNKRVKEYVEQRERVKKQVPKLSKEAKPEEIQTHQTAFATAVRVARANARPGDLFEPHIAEHIRALIKAEFKGSERVQLRKTILEAETAGVAVKINYPYPDTKELSQVPPTLLLKLPQLPTEVKYRFVNYHLLLVDTDNDLIIDYMLRALP